MIGVVPATRAKKPLGQYFTPDHIAKLMLSMTSKETHARVLEPSSGTGVFLDVLYGAGYENVSAVEVDAQLARHQVFEVNCQSFLTFGDESIYELIIGNPPYIRWKDLPDDSRDEIRSNPHFGQLFNSLADYLTAFIVRAVQLLKTGGELIFITPSFWMHTQHSESLRDWLLQQGAIDGIVDFKEARVFPGVNSAIVIFRFVKGAQPRTIDLWRYVDERHDVPQSIELTNPCQFTHLQIEPFTPQAHWTLWTPEELAMCNKLEASCHVREGDLLGTERLVTLGDLANIANGMVSGLDRAFQLPEQLLPLLNKDERDCLLPVVKAHQLDNFWPKGITTYINIPEGLTEVEAYSLYPHLVQHLMQYRTELDARYSYGRALPFWEWAFKRSERFFMSNDRKIFVPCKERLTNKPTVRFALASAGTVAVQDVTALSLNPETRVSLEYVLAYLNHPSVSEWIRKRGLMKGGIAEFSERPLASIPFRQICWSDPREVDLHDAISELVQRMQVDASNKSQLITAINGQLELLLSSKSRYQ